MCATEILDPYPISNSLSFTKFLGPQARVWFWIRQGCSSPTVLEIKEMKMFQFMPKCPSIQRLSLGPLLAPCASLGQQPLSLRFPSREVSWIPTPLRAPPSLLLTSKRRQRRESKAALRFCTALTCHKFQLFSLRVGLCYGLNVCIPHHFAC